MYKIIPNLVNVKINVFFFLHFSNETRTKNSHRLKVARLDFLGGIPPSLNIDYVAIIKDIAKRLPQLYYIKTKISYDLGFIAIRVAMVT